MQSFLRVVLILAVLVAASLTVSPSSYTAPEECESELLGASLSKAVLAAQALEMIDEGRLDTARAILKTSVVGELRRADELISHDVVIDSPVPNIRHGVKVAGDYAARSGWDAETIDRANRIVAHLDKALSD